MLKKYHIASFSGGKDSTAMVLRLLELGWPLDEVLCCDTTAEFPAMYRHIEKIKQRVEAAGVKFTVLRAEYDFEHYMLKHRPNRKKAELVDFPGYSWPGPRSRWCTTRLKIEIINRYLSSLRLHWDVVQYVGIAADEVHRLERKNNQKDGQVHPLVEWGWSESDAIDYCRHLGYDWEGLYDIFDRVSCWLCPLQSLADLRNLRRHFPDLWAELGRLDAATWRSFKEDYSVADLELRFSLEDALVEEGEKITDRRFFSDLRSLLDGQCTIPEILEGRSGAEVQLSFFKAG